MRYKISCVGDQLVLTLIPDESINVGKLHHAELFLSHAMSTSITCLIVDLNKLTALTPMGCWTMFQMAYHAQEHGKRVLLYRAPSSILPVLQEADLMSLAGLIENEKQLDQAIKGKSPSFESTDTSASVRQRTGTMKKNGRVAAEASV